MGNSKTRGVEERVKVKLDRSSSSGSKPKEEDNAALASKGQLGQQRQKKDISKVKCFKCGKMGHYASFEEKRQR